MAWTSWGYTDKNGPHVWEITPHATGKRQSPVVIHRSHAKYDVTLKERKLRTKYVVESNKTLHNTGQTVQITIAESHSHLMGGPLHDDYTLKQFHFHWGSKSDVGSEHKVDDRSYAAELHFVHWNAARYATCDEAMKVEDGLAVLTVFLQSGREHAALRLITDLLPQVRHAGDMISLPALFNPASLLPDDTDHYWTYHGSLTTPPCYESVRFIIFKEPIEVSEAQLNSFRSLKSVCPSRHGGMCMDELAPAEGQGGEGEEGEEGGEKGGGVCGGTRCCRLINNYRPTMPLHDRVIHASFNKD